MLDAGVPVVSAIHALTAGAIGTMILAVMPRVTLGHTGRDLTADRLRSSMFVLINAAAVARIAASWHMYDMMVLLALSADMLDRRVRPVRNRVRPDAADTATRAPGRSP